MLKFSLLFAFVFICIQWLYRPLDYQPSEEMINQYRPSMKITPNENTKDTLELAQDPVSPTALRFLIAYE